MRKLQSKKQKGQGERDIVDRMFDALAILEDKLLTLQTLDEFDTEILAIIAPALNAARKVRKFAFGRPGGASMRMTKRKLQLLKLYQRERARGFAASWALSNARTRLDWDKHEVAEYTSGEPIDPKRGHVRLRAVPDDTCSLDDLEGDCFSRDANPTVPPSRLQRDREDLIAKINADGVWGVIGEYFDGETWQHADSCFGFFGDDWKYSGYDTDIMYTTLTAARNARFCRTCRRPIIRKKGQ